MHDVRHTDGVVAGGEPKNNMIHLYDTFNNVLISKHRTILAAVKAQIRHLRAVRRRNGENSYLTYAIEDESGPVSEHLIMRAEQEVRS